MGKINFGGLLIAGLACLMSSCLGSDNLISDEWNYGNAQIASFSLSNDSIAGLSDVEFTIDQMNGKIYNRDSMPYGTVIDEKVICSMSFISSIVGILMVTQATNDTVYWSSEEDSIDFSSPVMITIYAYDGVSTKTYEAKINIHQVDPDSMVWGFYSGLIPEKAFEEMKVIPYDNSYYMYATEQDNCRLYKTEKADLVDWTEIMLSGFPAKAVLSQIAEYGGDVYVFDTDGMLYRSVDGQTWSQIEDAPYIKALLGFIPEGSIGREPVLSAISKVDETLRFVVVNKEMEWLMGNEVPDFFPLSGFGMFRHEVMYYPYLTISSGRDGNDKLSDMTWSTMDGLSWISLTNEQMTFPGREGAAFFYYNDLFYIAGGMDESGKALNDVYYSKDKGVTWWQDTIHVMPGDYTARGFSSVDVDEDNFVLLFGGKAGKDTNVLNELWRGRINRLGFMKD
jgi:hypothetical protein